MEKIYITHTSWRILNREKNICDERKESHETNRKKKKKSNSVRLVKDVTWENLEKTEELIGGWGNKWKSLKKFKKPKNELKRQMNGGNFYFSPQAQNHSCLRIHPSTI